MENVLSQDEIDSLLNAISSGELDTEEVDEEKEYQNVKNYDFRRPNKFSKEHISTIRNIYDNYTRVVSNVISNYVRTNADYTVVSVEQITFGEFIRSMPNPTVLGIYTVEPLDGVCVLEVSPALGFEIVDLLLGGSATNKIKVRDFTDIEIRIIRDILDKMIETSKNAWADIVDVDPVLQYIETNPQLNQLLSYNEAILLITFKVEINEQSNFVNMCIPYHTLESILDKLNIKTYEIGRTKKATDEYKGAIENIISSSKVNLNVIYGKANITVQEFLELNIGDIIQLDTKIEEPLKLYVEKKERFYVQPGLYKNKLSVQVVDTIGKDVE